MSESVSFWILSSHEIPGRFEVPVQMDSDIVMPCDSSQCWNFDDVQSKLQPNASKQREKSSTPKVFQEHSPVDTLDISSFRTLSTCTVPDSLSARSTDSDNLKVASRQSSATDLGQRLQLRLRSCESAPSNPECSTDRSYDSDVSLVSEDCFLEIREFDAAMCGKLSGILPRKRSLMRAESFDWPMAPHKDEYNNIGFFQKYMDNVGEDIGNRPLMKTKSLDKPPLDLSNMIAQFKMSKSKSQTSLYEYSDDDPSNVEDICKDRKLPTTEHCGADVAKDSTIFSGRSNHKRASVDSLIMIPR